MRTDRNIAPASESEIERQTYYIQKIRQINDELYNRSGRRPLMLTHTFGCQMNAHDSEKLEGMLRQMGYEVTEDEKEANIILFNTCCIRGNAENKVYGNLGFLKHIKKERPDFKIVLCGCMMQQDSVIEKIKRSYQYVDVIFGTFNLHRFPELLYSNIETGSLIIDVWKEHTEIFEDLPVVNTQSFPDEEDRKNMLITSRKYPFKASVNIMYGCNNFCTYCVVPYVRGRERSRQVDDILRETVLLAENGVKEIMLLGQNVNSYGSDLNLGITFAGLLKKVAQIEGIERVRFMTSHPKDISDELIAAIRDEKKICKYIHLPCQSGSTNVLSAMNRRYTNEHYINLIDKIRKEIPQAAITTDIIVGFPGETEQDFEETLDLIRYARFNGAFTFLYSIRTGTPAATMKDQVPEIVAKERFGRLLKILNPIILEKNETQIGKVLDVLVEEKSGEQSEFLTGRAGDNSIVHFMPPSSLNGDELIGRIVDVRITGCKTFYLNGEMMQ